MTGEVLLVGVITLAASAALLVVGALSQHDGVPRNWWVGVRTPSTMRSDEAWFAAQRAASWFLVVAGALGVATGVFWLVMSPDEDPESARWLIVVIVGLLVVPALAGTVAGVRAARRVGRRRGSDRAVSAGP